MFSSPPASPTNRSLPRRPSYSNRCHPERSEGSAFLFSPIRVLTVFLASPLFSYSYALFCHHENDNLFVFTRFRTLSQKHPGWGHLLQTKIFSFGNLATHYSPLSTISFIIRTYEKRARNSRRIRTSKTQHLKPFRMNTYKKTGRGAPSFRFQSRLLRTIHHPLLTTHYSLSTTHFLALETCMPNGASLSMYVQERPGGPGPQVLTMRRFLIAIASLAVLPAILSAQRGGMGAGMAHPAMAAPAPHVAMHASAPVATHASSGSRAYAGYPRFVRTRSGAVVPRSTPRVGTPIRSSGSRNTGQPIRSQDVVPGLGFDYPHLAAIQPRGIHGRDGDRDRDRRFSDAFFPLFFGGGFGFPLFPDDIDEAPPADVQQQADAGQQEPEQSAARPADYEPRQSRARAAQIAAEPEAAEPYVFVRRDGTVFFANAYAWENGTLRYITTEGFRRSVTADKLDLNATQQFNEQRGLTFRMPA